MAKRPVIVEFTHNRDIASAAFSAAANPEATLDPKAVPKVAGLTIDSAFAATQLPGMRMRGALDAGYESGVKFDLASEPKESTYLVRGTVDEKKAADLVGQGSVVGVYADVEIQPALICPGDPALGSDTDVERLLCADRMRRNGLDGLGVLVAIVDTGINMAYLNSRGKTPNFDATRSWVPQPGLVPGSLPVSHGTMCAYDACIAAPECTLLDVALLRSTATGPTPMSGVLSDAVRAYGHLLGVMSAPRRPGESRSLVVNNSWGMFHPSWDFPVGHPGNYSDNPNHPFNRIVASLERAGADILFAAGNCGADCPDGRCQGVTTNAIYGANGSPSVLCIAGVDVRKNRVGYSTQGPGRLSRNKPDLCGFTHFRGSGVYQADGGTSAATPVVAGVVAAIRTKRPYEPGNPAAAPASIRAFLRSTAEDLGTSGYDFDHGFGVVNGCRIAQKFNPPVPNICQRYPWICRPRRVPIRLCRLYPWICRPIRRPLPLGTGAGSSAEEELVMADIDAAAFAQLDAEEALELLLELELLGREEPTGAEKGIRKGDCNCSHKA